MLKATWKCPTPQSWPITPYIYIYIYICIWLNYGHDQDVVTSGWLNLTHAGVRPVALIGWPLEIEDISRQKATLPFAPSISPWLRPRIPKSGTQ